MHRHLRIKPRDRIWNGHQPTQRQSRQLRHVLRQLQHVRRRNARFGVTAIDVDLQADLQRRQMRRPLVVQALGNFEAIDRVHRIGQEEPVTAWRIVAAQTIDAKIAELIDSKAGLAARALDGAEAKTESEDSVQLAALISVLRDEIRRRGTYEVDES